MDSYQIRFRHIGRKPWMVADDTIDLGECDYFRINVRHHTPESQGEMLRWCDQNVGVEGKVQFENRRSGHREPFVFDVQPGAWHWFEPFVLIRDPSLAMAFKLRWC